MNTQTSILTDADLDLVSAGDGCKGCPQVGSTTPDTGAGSGTFWGIAGGGAAAGATAVGAVAAGLGAVFGHIG